MTHIRRYPNKYKDVKLLLNFLLGKHANYIDRRRFGMSMKWFITPKIIERLNLNCNKEYILDNLNEIESIINSFLHQQFYNYESILSGISYDAIVYKSYIRTGEMPYLRVRVYY